jgi:hypothetical protein
MRGLDLSCSLIFLGDWQTQRQTNYDLGGIDAARLNPLLRAFCLLAKGKSAKSSPP